MNKNHRANVRTDRGGAPFVNQPAIVMLLGVEMLITTEGRERTKDEFNKMLNTSKFQFSRIIQTETGVC